MKQIIAAALLATTALATPVLASESEEKLVTVITSPDPQTQLMAMVLTMQGARLAETTHILLCGPAGDLALKDAPETATAGQPPRDMSPQGLMQMIRENANATVEVCAIYLPARGEDASVLLDGIGVAKPGEMAAKLMDDDARVLSF
jgi:hypothetical protein